MDPTNVTPEEWVNNLKLAIQEKKYIVVRRKEFSVVDKSQFDFLQNHKLSISEIVEISKKKFEKLQENFQNQKIDQRTFDDLENKISDYTIILINSRRSKRNGFWLKLARGIAFAFSAPLSLVGIPLFKKLRKMDDDFNQEIRQLQQTILNYPIQLKINEQVKRIPVVLNNINQALDDTHRLEQIKQRMVDDFPKEGKAGPVHQFELDMIRKGTFHRKDNDFGLEDQTPQPSGNLAEKDRVNKAVSLLKELFRHEEDKRWEIALQLVANQTSLNVIFDAFILFFNIDSANNKLMWIDPQNQNNYGLKAVFSEKTLPSIHLEIIRHRETSRIEKVNVEVQGFIDIVRYRTDGGSEEKIIAPLVLKGELRYSVTLDQNNHPVISDLHSQLTSNIKPLD